jgi:hypothetical protein
MMQNTRHHNNKLLPAIPTTDRRSPLYKRPLPVAMTPGSVALTASHFKSSGRVPAWAMAMSTAKTAAKKMERMVVIILVFGVGLWNDRHFREQKKSLIHSILIHE